MVRPSVAALFAVFVFSAICVALVATDVLGTVWLVVGPGAAGAAEIIASHLNPGRGQAVEAGEGAPAPAPVPSPY